MYDENAKYLGYTVAQTGNPEYFSHDDKSIWKKAAYIRCDFILTISSTELSQMTQIEINNMLTHVWVYSGFKLQEPHYNRLENKYKKETGQVFFRSSLEGSIKIFGTDFFLRIDRLLDWSSGSGYQLQNGMASIGAGGIFGMGLNNTPIYFPEPQTDFIFTSYVANFGFLGASFLGLAISIAFSFGAF